MNILLLGATGLVGRLTLEAALAHPQVTRVITPVRHPLGIMHPKLEQHVLPDFNDIDFSSPAWQADAVICALGTTIKKAGSRQAFRQVDYDYPLAFAKAAQAQGARAFALTSAKGANSQSLFFYNRVKGELEEALKGLNFPSLSVVRPSLIQGDRKESRWLEQLSSRVLAPVDGLLPDSWRMSPAINIAQTLLQQALDGSDGIHTIESEQLVSTKA